ncbi:hypothetical protein BKA64DRAFT_459389 [Cadophora sp. MPI-SDFR-AT-0126]|nr:hypothetical protein BKA64DRAFT_459389 [Leotiomycetes sp. MPI-SDFR-AT-0126]
MSRIFNEAFNPHRTSSTESASLDSSDASDFEGTVYLAPKKRYRPSVQQPHTTPKIPNFRNMNDQTKPQTVPDTFVSMNTPKNITFAPNPANPRARTKRGPAVSATSTRRTIQIEVQGSQNNCLPQRDNDRPQSNLKRKNVLKFWSKPGAEFVQLCIGPKAQVFSIHLGLISHYSSYFRHAFSRLHGIEGQSKAMILKDVEVSVFGIFNQWLYTQEIECEGISPDLLDIAKLWTYGGIWNVWQLQNEAMKLLISLVNSEPEGPQKDKTTVLQQCIDYAYITKEQTALKRLAVHKMMSFASSVDNPKQWINNFPQGMLADFTAEMVKYTSALPNFQFPVRRQNSIYMVAAKMEVDLNDLSSKGGGWNGTELTQMRDQERSWILIERMATSESAQEDCVSLYNMD